MSQYKYQLLSLMSKLLQNYNNSEYSQQFQKMMNRAIGAIQKQSITHHRKNINQKLGQKKLSQHFLPKIFHKKHEISYNLQPQSQKSEDDNIIMIDKYFKLRTNASASPCKNNKNKTLIDQLQQYQHKDIKTRQRTVSELTSSSFLKDKGYRNFKIKSNSNYKIKSNLTQPIKQNNKYYDMLEPWTVEQMEESNSKF